MAHILDTIKGIQTQLGQVLKLPKIHVSIIFYHFLSKISETFKPDRKIEFQNAFTSCIIIEIDGIWSFNYFEEYITTPTFKIHFLYPTAVDQLQGRQL